MHLLAAICHQLKIVLGQVAVDSKITAILPLLRTLVLEGRLVTMDALLTQREVAQEILCGRERSEREHNWRRLPFTDTAYPFLRCPRSRGFG